MNEIDRIKKNNEVLDRLKEHFKIGSDYSLFKFLGFKNQATISNIRTGAQISISERLIKAVIEKDPKISVNYLTLKSDEFFAKPSEAIINNNVVKSNKNEKETEDRLESINNLTKAIERLCDILEKKQI